MKRLNVFNLVAYCFEVAGVAVKIHAVNNMPEGFGVCFTRFELKNTQNLKC